MCFNLIFLFALGCNVQNIFNIQKPLKYEIQLSEKIKIKIPIYEAVFSDSLTYRQVEIWNDSQQVYVDSSMSEYLFDKKHNPLVFELKNGNHEVLLQKFDAPDFNKTMVFSIKDGKVFNIQELAGFENEPMDFDNDGKIEYCGILNVSDTYINTDSCFYNPTLYYELTENGIKIDSSLTKFLNEKTWGGFYGFVLIDKVVPCPKVK